MKKEKKITLMVAGCMILAGLVMAAGGFAAIRFDVSRLNTISYDTNSYEIEEGFHHIAIDGGSSDVRFYPSEEDTCKVVCTEGDDVTFVVEVKDDTLHVRRQNSGMRIVHFGVNFGETGISVYVPENTYESLTVHTISGNVAVPEALQFASADIRSTSGEIKMLASTGSSLAVQATSGDIHIGNTAPESLTVQSTSGEITVKNVNVKSGIQVKSTSGDITFTDVRGQTIAASATSGEITFSEVIADGNMRLESTSGDVELRNSDGSELYIRSSSGDVYGTLLSEKVFRIHTSSGDVNAPYSASGGKCEVTTRSGDIDFVIKPTE